MQKNERNHMFQEENGKAKYALKYALRKLTLKNFPPEGENMC